MALLQSVDLAHIMLSRHLNDVSYVVDATCGNGHDSAFIASILGRNGKLFCFDIQKQAIHNTKLRLYDVPCNVQLFQKSHSKMQEILITYTNQIDAIIFNLGFLPQADKKITTLSLTTLDAIQQSETLLRRKGLLLIITYPGHTEGKDEDVALQDFLQENDVYFISKYQNIQNDRAPILYALQKK